MTLLSQLLSYDLSNISIAMVSTTAKKSNENRLLPMHWIQGKPALNIILNDTDIADECMRFLSEKINLFLIDVERKQAIDLWGIASTIIDPAKLISYKPNDITYNAAYFYLNRQFNNFSNQQSVVIYGTGNIAVKLALCLVEQNAQVSLHGRDTAKTQQLISSINKILPKYAPNKISLFDKQSTYDCLVTVLSAEHVVDVGWLANLQHQALVLDIGINNLTAEFIQQAEKKSIKLMRLDVRVASPMLDALVEIHQELLLKRAGRLTIDKISCVAGGVIGQQGDLILDSIIKPTSVVGVANGTGGVQRYDQYTAKDNERIKIVKAYLQCD